MRRGIALCILFGYRSSRPITRSQLTWPLTTSASLPNPPRVKGPDLHTLEASMVVCVLVTLPGGTAKAALVLQL